MPKCIGDNPRIEAKLAVATASDKPQPNCTPFTGESNISRKRQPNLTWELSRLPTLPPLKRTPKCPPQSPLNAMNTLKTISSLKKEIVVALFLIATLATVFANQMVRRKFQITNDGTWNCHASDDRHDGGNSTGQCNVDGSSFKLRYKIGKKFHSPYAIMSFRPESDKYFDLSWAENVSIKISASHEEHLLFQIRNFESAFSDKSDAVSRKYNEAVLKVGPQLREITLNLDDFNVPSWWQERYAAQGANARVDLSQAEWFEFTTRSRSGSGIIQIESIVFEGHWVSMATMYQYLLWMWLGIALSVLLSRVHDLRNELARKRQIQEQLSETNNKLELKSEEYSIMARQDSLTGLMNRLGIHESIQQHVQNKNGTNFSIVLLDLDNFKSINDQHGHLYGDEVLCDIASITRECLRKDDMIARWGGDEFIAVLPGASESDAAILAEKIRTQVSSSRLKYTCSFGIAETDSGIDFRETFKRADDALYRSKDEGRDRVNLSSEYDSKVDTENDLVAQ